MNPMQTKLSGETLIPLSFIAIMAASVFFAAQISGVANENKAKIHKIESDRKVENHRIIDRLIIIERDLSDLKAEISSANGKLKLLLELQKKDSP